MESRGVRDIRVSSVVSQPGQYISKWLMTSKRGIPSYIVFDNGTNLVDAERELRPFIHDHNKDRIVRETNKQHQVEWKLNPPAVLHFGGVWEAIIKSVKRTVTDIPGNADVNDDELHTAICSAESQPRC